MALPASGAINLNEIHVEAGGTTGASCTINDSDIRGLVSAASGSAMDFADWYGASSGYTSTLTVAYEQGEFCLKGCSYWDNFGYTDYNSGGMGTLSDNTVDVISGAPRVVQLYWDNFSNATGDVWFALDGLLANSGWTTLTIGGVSFSRASATYAQVDYTANDDYTRWGWSQSNPFGTTVGATKTVTVT
jgi:hypothetical protein